MVFELLDRDLKQYMDCFRHTGMNMLLVKVCKKVTKI